MTPLTNLDKRRTNNFKVFAELKPTDGAMKLPRDDIESGHQNQEVATQQVSLIIPYDSQWEIP